ncbi:SRPBCC domain-containing protein [Fluviispira multicolorata]|uniref:SRPBCC domain-containing protein n=1 Tax=Fluviispira multicolorata TaxID=2654512 RepID=A0A833JEC5_9BACT|nr:SRPBCC domain-containing protein [Fluviispira multicolorata]KAB8029870.1 SRPBCC domain-containing protein [Fluviispira multicolorata]
MRIETNIQIKAPVEKVWNKLADFKSYLSWNFFITKIEGEQREGEKLIVNIAPPGGSPATFKPVITKYVPNKELRWVGTLGPQWLFRGEHYFQLKDNGDGTTDFMHGENFSGWLVPLFSLLAGKKTATGFGLMNSNLKHTLEKNE